MGQSSLDGVSAETGFVVLSMTLNKSCAFNISWPVVATLCTATISFLTFDVIAASARAATGADREAASLSEFRKSQEPAERVTTIKEDAAAQKRRKAASLKGTGKQSTILSGVQTALKARLGE